MAQVQRPNNNAFLPEDSQKKEKAAAKQAKKRKEKNHDDPPIKVKVVVYNSGSSDDASAVEKVLSQAASFPEEFEIMSEQQSITQSGQFVYALVYKQSPPAEKEAEEELEITIETDDI